MRGTAAVEGLRDEAAATGDVGKGTDLAAAARRVGTLLDELEAIDGRPSALARELLSLVAELYGEGLRRVLAMVGPDTARRLGDDEVVGGLLAWLGLHPVELPVRAAEAVEACRRAQGLAPGSLELVSADSAGVRVRLTGSQPELVVRELEAALAARLPDAPSLVVEQAVPLAAPVVRRARRETVLRSEKGDERCELCGTGIGKRHAHLVEVASGRLVCACAPCTLLFEAPAAGRYRAVPDRVVRLEGFRFEGTLADERVPVGVAFFRPALDQSAVVACYPGPAGATEASLPNEAWAELVSREPRLEALDPVVEALLVRAERHRPAEAYLVPLDACYELVGILRERWRGLEGGAEAKAALDAFFEGLRERAGGRRP